METFNRFGFQNGFQPRPMLQPRMGQVGTPTARATIERMRVTYNKARDLLDIRNPALSMEYRVTGPVTGQLRSMLDRVYGNQYSREAGWIYALDRRPTAPYWDDPASPEMLRDASDLDNAVNEFEGMVSAAEAKAGQAAPPPSAPGGSPGITQAGMLPPTSMLVLGLLAVGTFVGAALLGGDHSGFFMAGRRR